MIPVIYPSAGEFWLKSYGYPFNNLSDPDISDFYVNSQTASEVAALLGISLPLYVAAPHENFKRRGPTCVVQSFRRPFPPNSFVKLQRGGYDIYIAGPELSFLLAARRLDLIDLVKFGYDLCALYADSPGRRFCRDERTPVTSVSKIRDYINKYSYMDGSAKALKALKHVHDFSNSPFETRLAMFATLPPGSGGCGIPGLEMNKTMDLTDEGKRITGYARIRGDMVFRESLVVEYNSNTFHLQPRKYTDDMNRQTALKLAGYDYIAITSGNTRYMHALLDIMNAVRIRLGMPPMNGDDPAMGELYFRLFP